MHYPQAVKTTLRPRDKLSPAAQLSTLALLGQISSNEDPTTLEIQKLEVQQIITLLLQTAGQFHEGECKLERVLGALMAGAAWIAHHHGVIFEDFQGPKPPTH